MAYFATLDGEYSFVTHVLLVLAVLLVVSALEP